MIIKIQILILIFGFVFRLFTEVVKNSRYRSFFNRALHLQYYWKQQVKQVVT